MRFAIIRPAKTEIEEIEAVDYAAAVEAAGLKRNEIDHGVIRRADDQRGIAIAVYEFSLFVTPAKASYFAIGDQLFAGNALLYGFDEGGETIDLTSYPVPHFFASYMEVEAAIAAGFVRRPRMTVNGQQVWAWPQPRVL